MIEEAFFRERQVKMVYHIVENIFWTIVNIICVKCLMWISTSNEQLQIFAGFVIVLCLIIARFAVEMVSAIAFWCIFMFIALYSLTIVLELFFQKILEHLHLLVVRRVIVEDRQDIVLAANFKSFNNNFRRMKEMMDEECSVCYENCETASRRCNHVLCFYCYDKIQKSKNVVLCPLCRVCVEEI